jgi:hypothetical protein
MVTQLRHDPSREILHGNHITPDLSWEQYHFVALSYQAATKRRKRTDVLGI